MTRTTHGQTGTPLYRRWVSMISRCENPNEPGFEKYGAKGINVCQAWRASFEAFRDWALANGYRADLTIDRFPNNAGNYEPGNCRWATYTEQNRNQSRNRPILYKGESWFIGDLAKAHNLPDHILRGRVHVLGWTIERALSAPIAYRSPRKRSA